MNRLMIKPLMATAAAVAIAVVACASTEEAARHSESGPDNDGFAQVISPELPSEISFAGDKVEFDRMDMFERMDRELTSIAYTHGTTLLMMKRANKYFPEMAPILKQSGVPVDFLYLAMV